MSEFPSPSGDSELLADDEPGSRISRNQGLGIGGGVIALGLAGWLFILPSLTGGDDAQELAASARPVAPVSVASPVPEGPVEETLPLVNGSVGRDPFEVKEGFEAPLAEGEAVEEFEQATPLEPGAEADGAQEAVAFEPAEGAVEEGGGMPDAAVIPPSETAPAEENVDFGPGAAADPEPTPAPSDEFEPVVIAPAAAPKPQGPADPKPGDGKPGDGVPGDGKPGDGVPGDGKPGDGVPGDGKPGDGVPGDGKPGDGVPGDGKPGDGVPGDGKPGDGVPGDGKPGDGVPGDGVPGDGVPGDGKPDPKPVDPKPVEQTIELTLSTVTFSAKGDTVTVIFDDQPKNDSNKLKKEIVTVGEKSTNYPDLMVVSVRKASEETGPDDSATFQYDEEAPFNVSVGDTEDFQK